MSEACSTLWMKQGADGCSWCPVVCQESSRGIRPLETKLGSQCCFHMYFVDCGGEIVPPPGITFVAQAKDEDGDTFFAALDADFERGTDAAGDDYLHFCLDANTEPLRQEFAEVPGRCCKPKPDDKLCLTLEIAWEDGNQNWSASCDIRWCIKDAVIDPDFPVTEIPNGNICDRVAACFGGITSPDNTITVTGNFQDGFQLTTEHTLQCQPFTVNAGTTADITDDSLGTASLACGETLHFHDPNGLITVTDGSAIVRLDHPDACEEMEDVHSLVSLDCGPLPVA